MANPYIAYVSTYAKTGANGQSACVTFSFANTNGFDAFIPIKVLTPANVSAGAEVYYKISTDGGANYETEATLGAVFARANSSTQVKDLILRDPGIYVIQVLVGGGSAATWSVDFGSTIALISAYA